MNRTAQQDPTQWFRDLVGFTEENPTQVRDDLLLDDEHIMSLVTGRRLRCGRLDTPSLAQLRAQTSSHESGEKPLTVREVVGDVKKLHTIPEAHGALFQAASQFNLLEMNHPRNTPEMGVGIYGADPTQGPACAVACGAGTIYRNYFAKVDGGIGQTADRQIDCLKEFGEALGNGDNSLWHMQNGYAIGREEGLSGVQQRLQGLSEKERDVLRGLVRIGVQYGTEVTIKNCNNIVTQAYCSAFPVAYSGVSTSSWESVARLLLEASYECTLRAALLNWDGGGSSIVYLTLVGGGVFRNNKNWIFEAMERAFFVMRDSGLDVRIVSYMTSSAEVRGLER